MKTHTGHLHSSLFLVCMLASTAFHNAAAFTIPSSRAASIRPATALNVHAANSEEEAITMIMEANICAHSETCSIEEAEAYLNEMLHLQSDCVSGSLSNGLICDDVTFPSEVIAGLRDKIQRQVELSNEGSNIKVGWNPIFLSILALYVSSGLLSLAHNNPDSFTMQEWMYAIQGGYLDDMVSQYIKYGGLSPVAAVDDGSYVTPLTLQEWWWSIRDGYVGSMISEYSNHGGFLSFVDDNAEDVILTTPFTNQEWSYAVKDGYLSNLIDHYMRNGGL